MKRSAHLALILLLVACQSSATPSTPGSQATQAAPQATASPAPATEAGGASPEAEPVGATAPPASTTTPSQPPEPSGDDRTPFRSGLTAADQGVLERLPGATVYHIDFEIPEDFLVLKGHQAVRYTNRENQPLDEIYFRLFPNTSGGAARVSGLSVDGQPVEPVYEFADSAIRVVLPAALDPGQETDVQLDFEVEVAREMAGNYGLFGYFEGVLVLDEFYPAIPVYDDEGWNVETPPPNADSSYFDASFYLVRVTAPAGLTLVASGVEIDRQIEAEAQVVTFAAGPARDFYLAASDKFTLISQTVGETTVNSYAFPEWEEGSELALEVAVNALQSFNTRFGVYPYTEFDIISTPMQALGIEYPGAVGISLRLYDPDIRLSGLPSQVYLESAVAHEVGHQWFYNVVGNDQIDEPWLDEALTQYVTGLYYLDTYGEGAERSFNDSWQGRWDRVDGADIPIGLPARAYDGVQYGAIVYGRGPLFIAALAEEMGQETFDAFLRDYYQSHQWGIGTGVAFKQLAEAHCQCDLTELFEEWVYADDQDPAQGALQPIGSPAPPLATRLSSAGEAPSPQTSAPGDGLVRGWAVLAQKDDYSDVDMTNLPVDYAGIVSMRPLLEDYHIHELREFDRQSLKAELDWLAQNADRDDIALLYVAAHGRYLSDVLAWSQFFGAEWAQIPSQRRLLVIDSCRAANYTGAISGDPAPYLSIAAVAGDEYGWTGLEEEGLPIIGGVFTHYFAAAFGDPGADRDADGLVSVQEAALMAEEQQRAYMHDVVFAVPEFVAMYHDIGSFADQDPTFPHVVVDDTLGQPLFLALDAYP
jgi:hypothetical protein